MAGSRHIQLDAVESAEYPPTFESGSSLDLGSIKSGQGTLVITRRIKQECLVEYEKWLVKIGEECAKWPGFQHRTIYPPSKVSVTQDFWTHIIHFDSHDDAKSWTESNVAHRLWEECEPFTNDTNIAILMDGSPEIWGMSPSSSGKHEGPGPAPKPLPLRQSLTVLVNLYPLLVVLSFLLEFVFGTADVPVPVRLFVGTAISVPTLTYCMIPYSMRYLGPWVFGQMHSSDESESDSYSSWAVRHRESLLTSGIPLGLLVLCVVCSAIWPGDGYAGDGFLGSS